MKLFHWSKGEKIIMAIIYHQMKFEPKENKYVVTKLAPGRNIDTSKIDSLMKLSHNLWAARRKQDLIDHAEEMKAAKITQCKERLLKLNKIKIEA